jgi:hypothetical protein
VQEEIGPSVFRGEIEPFERTQRPLSQSLTAFAAYPVRLIWIVVADHLGNLPFATSLTDGDFTHTLAHAALDIPGP